MTPCSSFCVFLIFFFLVSSARDQFGHVQVSKLAKSPIPLFSAIPTFAGPWCLLSLSPTFCLDLSNCPLCTYVCARGCLSFRAPPAVVSAAVGIEGAEEAAGS